MADKKYVSSFKINDEVVYIKDSNADEKIDTAITDLNNTLDNELSSYKNAMTKDGVGGWVLSANMLSGVATLQTRKNGFIVVGQIDGAFKAPYNNNMTDSVPYSSSRTFVKMFSHKGNYFEFGNNGLHTPIINANEGIGVANAVQIGRPTFIFNVEGVGTGSSDPNNEVGTGSMQAYYDTDEDMTYVGLNMHNEQLSGVNGRQFMTAFGNFQYIISTDID